MANNNSRDNNISINTNGVQLYNRDGFVPSALTIGYWNDVLNIRINPKLENPTETKVFDYEKYISCILPVERIGELINAINKEIVPAMKEGRNKIISIQVAGDSLLSVGTNVATGSPLRPFIAIYKGIDVNTKKPESYLLYEFKSSTIIEDYDADKGSYTVSQPDHVELNTFIKILNAAFDGLTKATAHTINTENRFRNAAQMKVMNALAEKSGIETGYGNTSYRKRGSSVSFGAESNNNDVGQIAQIESIDSLDDLPL